jgi:glycosyltransferase involved in cell wall biosynthesis
MSGVKKVAILTNLPINQVGGIERFNFYLKQLLEDYGFRVDVFCLNDIRQTFFKRLTCRFIPPLHEYYFLSQLIKNKIQNYNFVVTHNITGGGLRTGETGVYNATHGLFAAGIKRLREIDKKTKIDFALKQALFLERFSKKGKKGVIAVSRKVKEDLLKYHRIESTVINNGVDINHFKKRENFRELRKRYGIKEGEVVGLYVGHWDFPVKRVHYLLEVIKRRKDIKWIIATDKNIDINEYGNIILLVNISYAQMPEIYSIADFAIHLSIYEGFGYSQMEAIACSLPLISTRVGVVDEIFTEPFLNELMLDSWHDDNFFFEEINIKIDSLIKNKDRYSLISKRLRKVVEERFSLEVWREKMSGYFCLRDS